MSFVERTCSCCGGENPEKTRIDAILAKYEGVKGALIPILQEVQSLYNYLPKDALEYVAAQTGAGAILSAYARALPATYAAVKLFCRRWKKNLTLKQGIQLTTCALRWKRLPASAHAAWLLLCRLTKIPTAG